MSLQIRFVQPLDILNFRGNKSFGESGEHGVSQMPPQPSIFSGALRSYWLAHESVDFNAFAKGYAQVPIALERSLGTPSNPGEFRIQGLWLAKIKQDRAELVMSLPADTVALESEVHILNPKPLPKGLESSYPLPMHPLLRSKAEKPKSGKWLNQAGIEAYFKGRPIEHHHLIDSSQLWRLDERLGIAMGEQSRTAEDGKIYTTESIALEKDVGFVVSINGADSYPQTGNLRLGGDGRSAYMCLCDLNAPEPDWDHIEATRKFKIVLTTPAIFSEGWLFPDTNDEGVVTLGNGTGTLCSAAVPRFGVISGWDLARWQPKAAQRIAPTGSVYWISDWQGDIGSLQSLIQTGIGCDTLDPARRSEGYNNIAITNWI